MTSDRKQPKGLEFYELSRENRSLMMHIKKDYITISELKLQALALENSRLELKVSLEHAIHEIARLTILLEE